MDTTKLFARRPSLAMPFITRPSAPASSNVEEKHTSQNDDDDDLATVSSTQTNDTTKAGFSTGVKRIAARAGPRLSELLASSFSSFNTTEQHADNEGSPSSTTSTRKQFFHGRSPSFSFSSAAASETLSEEMNKLAEAINDKRKLLIQELLGLDGDAVIKVRFISAVNQYELCTNKDEKKYMGQKLVEIFVSGTAAPPPATMKSSTQLLLSSSSALSVNKQIEDLGHKIVELFSSSKSSREAATTSLDDQSKMFVLSSLSEDTTRRLGNGYLSHLSDAKREILQELSRNMLVMQAVSNVNSDVKW